LALFLAFAPPGQGDAAALLAQANNDLNAGRYAAAVREAQAAATLFEKLGKQEGQARAITAASLARMYSGEYTTALQGFQDALAMARKATNVGAEIARLNDIGNAYYFQGRYGDAMARYQEAVRRLNAAPNDRWNAWGRQLTSANIAVLYQSVGQFDRALKIYAELLHSAQSLPPSEQAQLLSNAGVLWRRLGDPQKALETYRAAQALYKTDAQHSSEIAVMNNIGIVQAMDFRDYQAAERTFSGALALAETSGDYPLAVQTRLYRGEAFYRAGKATQAADDYQTAARSADTLGQKEEEWKALYGLARLAAAKAETAKSQTLLRRAVTLIESLREGTGNSSLRSAFLADKRAVYDLLIENTERAEEAFPWMEASKSRMLRDRAGRNHPVSLQELRRGLPADTAVLEYWQGEDAGAVVWVSKTQSGMRRWRMSASDLEGVSGLPEVLANPQRADWREVVRPVAQELLRDIPLLKDAGIRRLRIVPDGMLAALPFETFPFGNGGLLVERFAISYLPSVSSTRESGPERLLHWPWQLGFAGFADPLSGSGKDADSLATPHDWITLPQAEREVREIAGMLPGKTAIFSGSNAQKSHLPEAARYPLLHFATHALAARENADLSYILLAPAAATQKFDYLFLKEVQRLDLSAVKLVVLAACETSVGQLAPGEGILGFSQAFLSAGAESVVSSLWNVGDKPTEQLMKRFYGGLANGAAFEDALRNAKLAFMQSKSAAHPAYWAGFVLAGPGNTRLPRMLSWQAIAFAALILLVLGGGVAVLTLRRMARRAQSSPHSRRP
jgi:CHAT domain-containing protein